MNDPAAGWSQIFGAGDTAAGVNVSVDAAMRASAVYACVRVLAESVATLPLKLYRRRKDGGKDEASDHPLYTILHDAPSAIHTSCEFRELLMACLNLRGNFYAIPEHDGSGRVISLLPLNPALMRVYVVDRGRNLKYEYQWQEGQPQIFLSEQIWHVRALSTDGFVGLSPIAQARETIGLYLATQDHGARMFKNDARPGGVLVHPGKLKEEVAARLKKRWTEAHTGHNKWSVAVLEDGMKWESIGFNNDDAQFLETRNFQVEDIARVFRVPSVLIGHPDKTMTYASAEQFFLSFVVHTIRPWVYKIEQSINRALLSEKDRKEYFAEFQLDGLLRGDTASRYNAYASARQNKWLSANEIRAKENLNPIEGGDVYENPNIATPGQANTADPNDPNQSGGQNSEPQPTETPST